MKKLWLAASVIAALGCASAANADGVRAGTLTCHESSGWGFIFGSSHSVRCVYTSADGAHQEHYTGDIDKFGVDVGYQASAVIVWAVFAPTDKIGPGALSGHYGGVTADATVGVGLGANALVGGSDRTIALQPVSIEGATGLNIAAGIAGLTLHHEHM
jgi:hypothetical protein